MNRQSDLIQWMNKKPTLADLKRRRLHDREIYDMARRGEVDITREELLDLHYGSSSAGQFFTPDPAAELVAALGSIQKDERVLDPAAGLGNLMLPALEYTEHVKGIELIWDTQELAVNNLGLDIIRGNAFEIEWPESDVILMNPPFGNMRSKPDWYPFKGRSRKEVAFLYLALKRVKRRVVSIVPNSLLSNNKDKPIRAHILEKHGLRASIDLPQKTFWKSTREINKWRWPVTNTNTGILVIDKEKPAGNYQIFMAMPQKEEDLYDMMKRWKNFVKEFET